MAELIRRCYGETYCVPEALDASWLAEALRTERELSALARTPDGRAVAMATLRRRSAAGLFECIRVVVDREHQRRGLMRSMTRWLMFDLAPQRGARAVFASAVTSHLYAQRNSRSLELAPLGLLLGVYPEYSAEGIGAADQAVSTIVHGVCHEDRPRVRRLRLSGRSLAWALAALEQLGIPAEVAAARARRRAAAVRLRFEADHEARLGLTHIRFGVRGGRPAGELEEALVQPAARITWADVPVEVPGAAAVVRRLRACGFGLGAYLPYATPRGEDVLRLQRYDGSPLRREGILVLDELAALRDLVYSDCAREAAPA